MNELEYRCEKEVKFFSIDILFPYSFFFLLFILPLTIFAITNQVYFFGVIVPVGYVVICYLLFKEKVNLYKRAIDRRDAMILNGVKVSGLAKKRYRSLYVTYKDPKTNEERGFETPELFVKAPEGCFWNCDVYIVDNELYATNFIIIEDKVEENAQ